MNSFHGRSESSWVDEVILDGIPGPDNTNLFKTRNHPEQILLEFRWKGGRESVQIDFVCVMTFRLQKKLMAILFSEFDHLVLNRGTVSGTNTGYLS